MKENTKASKYEIIAKIFKSQEYDDLLKELWNDYLQGGIVWQHRLVKFVIDNPEIVLKDDKIWEEFCTNIKDLHLYDLKINSTTDRLMVVQTVKINYNLIIDDKYIYY